MLRSQCRGTGAPCVLRTVEGARGRLSMFMMSMLVATAAGAAEGNTSRPQIRIAFFSSDIMPSKTIIRYMMKYLDFPGRTLLPDYDIVIDDHPHKPQDTTLCYLFPACRGAIHDAPTTLVGILGDDTPRYHAVVGPFIRQEVLGVVKLSARGRLLHVHGGDQPVLSDRTEYPYSFRCVRSLQGMQATVFHIAALNEWRSVVSVWWAEDLLANSNVIAESVNVTNYPTLADDGAAAWAVETWQSNIVELIRSRRMRVAILTINQPTGWQLICRVHRARISGLQYFVDEAWLSGWFIQPVPPSLGDCTADEMFVAAKGSFKVMHAKFSPGVNIGGVLGFPALGGDDQSQVPLTCMPGLTTDSFVNSGEQYMMAVNDGFIYNEGLAALYFGASSFTSDGICASLLALHDALYRKNISLEGIEAGEPTAFNELADSLGRVDFQGTTGRYRHYEGTGDLEYIYWVVGQEARSDWPNTSYPWVAAASFPNGPSAAPVFKTLEEEGAPVIWRDGSSGFGAKPHLGLFDDCGATNGVLVWDKCEACLPGTFYDPLLRDCRTCPPGQFQNESGKDSCYTAPLGWYVPNEAAPSGMAQCLAGHECPQVGTVSPQPCAPGRYAAKAGASSCELCPVGRYQNSSGGMACVSCEPVLPGSITAAIASTSSVECICPSNTYKPLEANSCSPCPAGMVCTEGSDMRNAAAFPEALPGYMTRVGQPLKVYRCGEEVHCPGGAPGSCADRRDPSSVACGDCEEDSYASGDNCVACEAAAALPFITTCLLGGAAVFIITLLINKDVHKTPAASMMIVAVAGLCFTSLQTMGVFNSIDIAWEEPVKTMLDLTSLISFDLDVLKVSCIMGVNPLRGFALRQLVSVVLLPLVLITLLGKKYAPKCGNPATQVRLEFCNSIGTFYSSFFISILLSALDPFICYEHPGDAGESVQSAPSLLCFEGDEHATMIVIGIIALCLVPLPFCCLCAYATATYPQKIKMHNTNKFLLATRFLFVRYVPQRYYFQIIAMIRSFLICLVPAIFRGKLATQVLFMSVILGAYVVIVNNLQPWRASHCNILDGTVSQALVTMVLCAALFIRETPQKEAVVALMTAIIIGILLWVILACGYALWKRLAPSCYHYFVCHHKAHAAAQARYLKMLLVKKRRNAQVFIDSDNLQELDKLFDIVKSRVKHLLVYLTVDTLKRPWCVGEIVTALRARASITRLHTPSFIAPSEEQRAYPDSYVDSTGCNLSEYGIEWADVSMALTDFLSTAISQLDLAQKLPGTHRFNALADSIVHQRSKGDTQAPQQKSELSTGGVLIVTDPACDEASASGGILVENIGPEVYRSCEYGISLLCDFEHATGEGVRSALQASVDIIILSAGCLQSPEFLYILTEVMYAQENEGNRPTVISVNVPGFEFPSLALIEKLCGEFPGLAFPGLAKSGKVTPAECVGAFFKRISILLPTHASQSALESQSGEIFRRIQGGMVKKSAKLSNGESNTSTTRISFAPSGSPQPSGSLGESSFVKLMRSGSHRSTSEAETRASTAQRNTASTLGQQGSIKSSPSQPYTWTWDEDDDLTMSVSQDKKAADSTGIVLEY